MLFRLTKVSLWSLFILLSSILSIYAMEIDQGTSASIGVKKKGPRNKREELIESMGLESYPTATLNLAEALLSSYNLISDSLSIIQFLDKLLLEVKEETDNKEKFSKYYLYFGRNLVVTGDSDEEFMDILGRFHKKIIYDLTQFKVLIWQCLKGYSEFVTTQDFSDRVTILILWANSWVQEKGGINDLLMEIEDAWIQALGKRKSYREMNYVDIFREDHVIGLHQDQKELVNKIIKLLLPYSSLEPCSAVPSEKLEEENEELIDITKEKAKKTDKNRKRRERAKRKKQELRQQQEQKSKALLDDKENKSVEGEEKKEIIDVNDKAAPLEKAPSLPPALPKETKDKASSKLEFESIISVEPTKTIERSKVVNKKIIAKEKPFKSKRFSVNKKNLRVLGEIFTDPITRDISIDDFDNLIRSEAGFRGRVYGGKRSQFYEVFVETHDGKSSKFLSFLEYQKCKKLGKGVEKYHFTLHRPHMRGKNKKGQTRFMYPALVELARTHLIRFDLTPEHIKSY